MPATLFGSSSIRRRGTNRRAIGQWWCSASYNGRAGMVALAGTPPRVVLADQVKSQDWRARKATRKVRVSSAELAEVRAKLVALIA